jgi:hypothetical protein
MIDRQKVETILRKRFPSATWSEIAAATNAIVGLGDEWLEIDCRDAQGLLPESVGRTEIRLFRRVASQFPE